MSQPYLSLEAELHDAFWDSEDDGSEVQLMADFLREKVGCALEIGSGSGRLMFPLVQMGFTVEGLELSEDMLALGKQRAARMGIEPVVHLGDMSAWNGNRKFTSLLAPAFTLQLAEDPAATLRHWHELLEKDGRLYLTMFMPYAELLGDLPENEWYEDHRVTLPDGRIGLLETRHELDLQRQMVGREHRYTLSGPSPQCHISRQKIRWFEHGQIVDLLWNCGFQVDHYFLDFDPEHTAADPDSVDFDGILTYHATRKESCDHFHERIPSGHS